MKKNYSMQILFAICLLLGLCAVLIVRFPSQNNKIETKETSAYRIDPTKYEGMTVEQIQHLPKYDRPDLALLQDIEMTKDLKLGFVPASRRNKAINELQKLKRNGKAIDNVNWVERGPDNVGGRTRALMYDPNDPSGKKVWVGAAHGGLWFNNDITSNQTKWHNINDFWANIAITSIAYDPANTKVFYVSTGENFTVNGAKGNGIWKTSDGGTTWDVLSSTQNNNDFTYIQKLVVLNTGVVVAGTNKGLFRSGNGGTSWNKVIDGYIYDIEVATNGKMYVSYLRPSQDPQFDNPSSTIKVSEDGGWSFLTITPASSLRTARIELASAPSDGDVLYAIARKRNPTNRVEDIAWLYKTEDGGSTWTALDHPNAVWWSLNGCSYDLDRDFTNGQGYYDLIIAVHPNDPDYVFMGGLDLFGSKDGGDSWTPITTWNRGCENNTKGTFDQLIYMHADQHEILFNPVNSNQMLFGNDGGVFLAREMGDALNSFESNRIEHQVNGYNVTQFYAVAMSNTSHSDVMIAGTQDNGTHRFRNAGINSTREITGGDGGFCHIDQDNPNFQIASYTYNNFWFSTNGFSSNSRAFYGDLGRFINPTDYDSDSDVLYSAGNSGQLVWYDEMFSTNPFGSQNMVTGQFRGVISAIKVSPYTANRIFIGTGNGLLYRVDNANSNPVFTAIDVIPSGVSSIGYISSIELGANEDQILVTVSNYGAISVWETRDGGKTSFRNLEGNLPDIPVRWALYNPNDSERKQVMLATELGVWTTDDVTASQVVWGVSNWGLANVRCTMLKHRAVDGLVVVSTYGRGIFTTNVWATSDALDYTGHWADYEIDYMLKNVNEQGNDYLSGYPDGTFRPDNELTRAEFATMIVNILEPASQKLNKNFNDINGHWAKDNILKAANAGYLSGYPDGSFKPNNKITKLEILVSIANGKGYTGGSVSELDYFKDESAIASWAKPAVANALKGKLIPNYPDRRSLNPTRNATRGEAVVLLFQVLVHDEKVYIQFRELNNYIAILPTDGANNEESVDNVIANTLKEKVFRRASVYPNPSTRYIQLGVEVGFHMKSMMQREQD